MTQFEVGDEVEVTLKGIVKSFAVLGGITIGNSEGTIFAHVWPNDFPERSTIELVQEPLPTGFGAVLRSETFGVMRRAQLPSGWWIARDGISYHNEDILADGGRVEVLFEGVTE